MIKTRLTELVGLKYPIIQAGMGPYPVTSLCIAAANAGCLGLCSTFATTSRETNPIVFEDFCKQAHAETTDDDVTIFKKMFTRVFEETKESDGIFGANVMVSAEVKANAMKVMQAIKELREADPEMKRRFRVLVTTAGDPMPWANFVKEQGMIWMHVFPGVRTAARCKKAGVQVLIASGHEGGMHTAWQPVHSMTLLPDIIEKFSDENTLVCGTGGFCDGKSIAAWALTACRWAPASSPPKRAISANCGRRWSSTAPTAARSLPAALSARRAGCAATCPCSMLTTPPRKPPAPTSVCRMISRASRWSC